MITNGGKKVLVVGGAGFIGSHLCDSLIELNNDVTIVTPETSNLDNISHLYGKIKIIFKKLEQLNDTSLNWSSLDVVYLLACTSKPKSSNENPINDITNNLLPAINLLDICAKSKVNKLVFTSSGGTVYGIPRTTPLIEEHQTNPICSYGIHKLAIEKYIQLYNKLYNLNYKVARISNAYGERQSVKGGQGLIASIIEKMNQNSPITIWGDGSEIRDYIHASDIASALISIANCNSDETIFNVGSGSGLTILNIIRYVENGMGKKTEIIWEKSRNMDVPNNVLDISKIKRTLDWNPLIDINSGIARCIRWCKR